jgi:hypothetical protein
MTFPIVELAAWSPGDPGALEIDALLADAATPLAKHGLTGLADAYARELRVPMHGEHRAAADHVATKALAVDGALTEVTPALRDAGVPFFVAKGPTIAYRDYADPRLRPYTDLDVYVPVTARADAVEVLGVLGYTPVAQVAGPLGGQPRELVGGTFGAVVEVHDSIVDNVHRRFLPPVDAYFDHVHDVSLCGVEVPVLRSSAHVALQAIHLGAGHRYAKMICFRDIAALLDDTDLDEVAELGAATYLSVIVDTLRAIGLADAEPVPGGGAMHRRLLDALAGANPAGWDEYGLSIANALALLHQPTARQRAASAFAAARALVPSAGRRVDLHV